MDIGQASWPRPCATAHIARRRRLHLPGQEALGQKSLVSIEALGQLLAANALVMALDRGGVLALTLGRRLFVELARAQFGQKADFFDGTLKTAQSSFKRLVFFKTNGRHVRVSLAKRYAKFRKA